MSAQEAPNAVAVSVEVVVFSIRDRRLKLLLVRRGLAPHRGRWALPGAFVRPDEDLDGAARRALAESTGVTGVYLEQLYTFGRPDRDPRGRVISVAYYALVPSDRLRLCAALEAEAVGWFALDELPRLAFDHGEIVAMAHARLRAKLGYSTIAFQFLGERFTIPELQSVYEIILGEPLDKRNFRKWVLSLGQIEETGELRRSGRHRPARLYRLVRPGDIVYFR